MQNNASREPSFSSFITGTKKQLQKDQWNEFISAYNASLEQWQHSYKLWQQSGEKALEYSKVMERASKENNIKLMRELTEKWSEAWNIAGRDNPYIWYWASWKKIWEESSYVTTNAFNQYWQKIWQDNSNDFFKKSD